MTTAITTRPAAQPVTKAGTFVSQFCTVLYFGFFALMPWYSRMDRTLPVPERVTA